MKKYYIQSRVTTGIKIFPKYNSLENDMEKRVDCSFEYDDLKFIQWDFSFSMWAHWDAWVVYNEVLASNFADAVNAHLKKLSQVLPRVFFCVPVWHSFGFHESLLISNDEFQTGFYFMRKERKWTWLVITDEILEVLESKNFQNIPEKFFSYYSEFINSNTALGWLSLGMGALEIIRPVSKKEQIELFWEDLRRKIYWTKPEWIRHKIHHWKYPQEWDNSEKDFEEMHRAIKTCLLRINPDIEKVYDLRAGFASIPRQKRVIEWHNWIYLFSENQKPLNLREIVKYDDTAFFEFQKKIRENLFISTDTAKKSVDY